MDKNKKKANAIINIPFKIVFYVAYGFWTVLKFIGKILFFLLYNIFGTALYYIGVGTLAFLQYVIYIPFKYIGAYLIRFLRWLGRVIRGVYKRSKAAIMDTNIVKEYLKRNQAKKEVLLLELTTKEEVRTAHKVFFRYEALDQDGKLIRGNFRAHSKVDVHAFLLNEGYDVFSIQSSSSSLSVKIMESLAESYKMKYKNLVFVLTQLETFLRSGITLVESLRILSRQTRDANQKMVLMGLLYDISNGLDLSDAAAEQKKAFPSLLISMIKTSEMTGDLNATLKEMVNYYSTINTTKKQMLSALSYPVMVFVFTIGVVVFMLLNVVPSFVDMFRQLESDMPPITQIVVSASDFLLSYWWVVLVIVVAIGVGLRFMYRNSKAFKYSFQKTMMRIPVIGTVIIYNEITMFTKTFASLLNHNVQITDSLAILQSVTNNEIYKELIYKGVQNLARGEDISVAFKSKWYFPDAAYEMLVTGEKTGEPGKMMSRVADYYQEQHGIAVNQVKTFIEPVLIVVLAGIVGTLLLAVFLPMLDIYGSVQV